MSLTSSIVPEGKWNTPPANLHKYFNGLAFAASSTVYVCVCVCAVHACNTHAVLYSVPAWRSAITLPRDKPTMWWVDSPD